MNGIFKKNFYFYYMEIREMAVGKKLWAIIIIKLVIMFAVLKLFFFHNFLNSNLHTDKDRANYVIDQLTR